MNAYTESGLNGHNFWAIFSEFYHGQYAPLNKSLYLVADRYVYMASIGACLLIAYYAVRFIKEWKVYWKTGLSPVFAAYLLYFGVYTNLRSRVWHDTDSLKKEIRELLKERNDYELRIRN